MSLISFLIWFKIVSSVFPGKRKHISCKSKHFPFLWNFKCLLSSLISLKENDWFLHNFLNLIKSLHSEFNQLNLVHTSRTTSLRSFQKMVFCFSSNIFSLFDSFLDFLIYIKNKYFKRIKGLVNKTRILTGCAPNRNCCISMLISFSFWVKYTKAHLSVSFLHLLDFEGRRM